MAGGKLGAYVELLRVHNLVVAALTTLIGYVTVVAGIGHVDASGGLVYAVAAVIAVAAGGYVINDYYDVGTDAIAKPWRPIPSGRVSRQEALALALVLFAAGALASLPLGAVVAAFVAVNIVSVYLYSAYIKRVGFVGNIVVALNSSATILMGALVGCRLEHLECPLLVLVPFVVSFLLVLGREVVKGIEDYFGDRAECYMTLAVRLGPARAARIALVLLLATIAVSPLPLLFPQYGLLYAALAAATDAVIAKAVVELAVSTHSGQVENIIAAARRARTLLKISFALGGLAFLLGPLQP